MTAKTPIAEWMLKNEADPFDGRYDCERDELPMGEMSDYRFANELYINGDRSPSIQELISGQAKRPIVWLTAAKDRIRWLGFQLYKAEKRNEPDMNKYISKEQLREFLKEYKDRGYGKVKMMADLELMAKEK